jgi:hypothetical protein
MAQCLAGVPSTIKGVQCVGEELPGYSIVVQVFPGWGVRQHDRNKSMQVSCLIASIALCRPPKMLSASGLGCCGAPLQ